MANKKTKVAKKVSKKRKTFKKGESCFVQSAVSKVLCDRDERDLKEFNVRTLADMSEEEILAIERRTGLPVRRPVSDG